MLLVETRSRSKVAIDSRRRGVSLSSLHLAIDRFQRVIAGYLDSERESLRSFDMKERRSKDPEVPK